MSELLRERIPEGGGNNGEGPLPPGPGERRLVSADLRLRWVYVGAGGQ